MRNTFLQFYRSLPWFKGKLRLGRILFKKYIEQSFPVQFKAHDGIYYHIPNSIENVGIELLINGVYELEIVRFLKDQIQDGTIYFDIGANIGSLGLPVLKNRKNIRYYGFEASPMVFEYLQKNIAANGISSFKLINKLVHKDDKQTMKFYESKWYGKSSLAPTYSHEFVMVESLSIDKFCKEEKIEVIEWMKIDVQGFELYVFEGMKEMLGAKKIKNILFEFEGWAEEAAGLKAGMALNYLKQMGYKLSDLKGKPWIKKKDVTMIWAIPN